ncbi:hypothetical protein C8Q80DRAFT_1127108 [Daedaleopsis nitida]|nr:hypothetical protein C8Q80DRAFT_1127108 [Daedaleopsis nitida]
MGSTHLSRRMLPTFLILISGLVASRAAPTSSLPSNTHSAGPKAASVSGLAPTTSDCVGCPITSASSSPEHARDFPLNGVDPLDPAMIRHYICQIAVAAIMQLTNREGYANHAMALNDPTMRSLNQSSLTVQNSVADSVEVSTPVTGTSYTIPLGAAVGGIVGGMIFFRLFDAFVSLAAPHLYEKYIVRISTPQLHKKPMELMTSGAFRSERGATSSRPREVRVLAPVLPPSPDPSPVHGLGKRMRALSFPISPRGQTGSSSNIDDSSLLLSSQSLQSAPKLTLCICNFLKHSLPRVCYHSSSSGLNPPTMIIDKDVRAVVKLLTADPCIFAHNT